MTAASAMKDMRALRDPKKAAFFPRFFKTGKGEYGEGDVFLGVTVPLARSVAKTYRSLPLSEIGILLSQKTHEFRLLGLFILVHRFQKADENDRTTIVSFYLDHLDGVNNWDLVDSSAPHILGAHCYETKKTKILIMFARSEDLWKQRIAMIATQYFIRQNDFGPTLRIAEILFHHPHDLIHKAVGWMLREVGDRDREMEEDFLKKHAAVMPRTMLRYAIEKFPPEKRKRYMTMKSR